jgi:hypothetical protein
MKDSDKMHCWQACGVNDLRVPLDPASQLLNLMT